MKKFKVIVLLLFAVIAVGVVGYMVLLNIDFVDALYMTAITISTVGYGEVGRMTDASKLFSIFIIFSGLGTASYGVSSLVSFFFEGNIKTAWRKRRMEVKIGELNNHYIVCGAGDVGRTVINTLKKWNAQFVVVEKDEARADELERAGILTITGNATNEDTLTAAGIDRAKGIVCCLNDDAENVFAVLTARQMNGAIHIISKAIEESAHSKLRRAGANQTISPNEIGGQRIAAHLLRPSVISFLDVITRAGDVILDLEQVVMSPNSRLVGKSLSEAKIPEQTGLIILALKKKDDETFIFNPGSGETLHAGDTMVVLGTKEQVEKLSLIVGD